MEAKWGTIYREGCIALDARQELSSTWIASEPGSEEERLLERVMQYLQDRFDIAMEFCAVINNLETPSSEEVECDIPF